MTPLALVLGIVLQDVASLDALPEDVPPGALAAHPAVRRLAAGYRSSIPELQAALGSTSWKARLAAAFVLRDMGVSTPLLGVVDDPHPRVRDFARAVLARPPRSPGTPYPRDPAQRDFSDGLLRSRPALDERERKTRARAVVEDLLRAGAPEEEREASRARALEERELALEALAERAGAVETSAVLNVLYALSSRGAPEALPERLVAAIDAGSADPDPAVRDLARRAFGALPEEERAARTERALSDPDGRVREGAVGELLKLAREAHDRGQPDLSDRRIERLNAFLKDEKDVELRESAREEIEKAAGRIHHERRMIVEGEPEDESGATRRRYLKVGRALIAVSAREHELCLARGRGPYIAEEDFRVLRAEANLELSARAAIPAVAPPPPKDVARPKAEALRTPARSTPSAPPGAASRRGAWILLGAVAIALTLGVLLWRARA